ncbi:hypothetical protein OV079_29250 [Nannocystis pusilla]|uniref:Transmembrane protein n=1 Tax=Nannocystis pusilla TaxID=889268 RepID=A0A9X3IZJ0_9BACT|nr:hypothetical protein [Nannocystis pusilla]MCY1009581.1 hypothetical protein [Nannocystis pusilla]
MQQQNTPDHAPASAGCALRLFWMLIGNAIVYASLATIAMNGEAFPSALDGVVWLTVALTIVARRVDITRWAGKTASGEPATLAHWRRYAITVVALTALASVLAHVIAASSAS